MRSVAQFYKDCLSVASQQPPLDLLLGDALGCVLAEDVVAPFAHPLTNVSACDGYAVVALDTTQATGAQVGGSPVTLMVTGEIEAGSADTGALVPGTAIRVASGVPLPIGADAVVPLESTDLGSASVQILEPVLPGYNVRVQGEDFEPGSIIITAGTRLLPTHVAALAAVGRDRVVVHPKPRAVIISVGDELVNPGQSAVLGTVFDANGHALSAAVKEVGVDAFRVDPVPDDRAHLREVIKDQLMRADLIVTTGGLSYGSADTVRDVFSSLGDVRFDRVAAWPGHMLGVGTVETEDGRSVAVYCLPGDPVAAQVAFEVYVRPSIRKMEGRKNVNRAAVKAAIDKGWQSPLGYREFVGVRLRGSPKSGYTAQVVGQPGHLWLSALAASNALAIVPEDTVSLEPGDELTCLLLEQ